MTSKNVDLSITNNECYVKIPKLHIKTTSSLSCRSYCLRILT